ncbi:MAG: undecaprenyldiphospho-muramoylpentapeptide beta-N-acetylglucosaminyltransferase [Armatimonadota bacterium]|nr:undecaprenyldiphospho-muramoylpentapeptide beta-N-acetylglucosaminyltransferase [Armatimonadota bacterium]
MRLALTGGGTGGHVFPALEVGRLAAEAGDDVRFFGSVRGIESTAAQAAGFEFHSTPATPIPKVASLAGLRAVMGLLRNARRVASDFKEWRPDALLATGGYSSGPSLRAAKSLGIPIVLHEQNSIPGRNTKMMGSTARRVCTVFQATAAHFPSQKVVLTGMPVRSDIVVAAHNPRTLAKCYTTLAAGGSQGARALNEIVTRLAKASGAGHCWIHVAGPKLFDEVRDSNKSMPVGYKLASFLDTSEMASALSTIDFAIVRAGCGTIAELAIFGVPAIFVPLPTSFANHQLNNAKEIENLGGGTVMEQADATPDRLKEAWSQWREDGARRASASEALRAWSKPDAAERVLAEVKGAVQ